MLILIIPRLDFTTNSLYSKRAMGTLYIVSTPIGNLEDITIRAVKTILSVDYIACEDTRRTGQLIKNLELRINNQEIGIKDLQIDKIPRLISYYDEVELSRVSEIINLLLDNINIALVSDSGTPLISDPGFKLIRECIKKEIQVVSIPGPSSIIAALTLSGLPTNQFLFLGYLPPKTSKRINVLSDLNRFIDKSIQIKPTIIIFESPHRIKQCLNDIKEVFGDIEIVIARELTKIHEDVWRGKITAAADGVNKFKGELVLLFNTPPK